MLGNGNDLQNQSLLADLDVIIVTLNQLAGVD